MNLEGVMITDRLRPGISQWLSGFFYYSESVFCSQAPTVLRGADTGSKSMQIFILYTPPEDTKKGSWVIMTE